jgi:hypothetical protein
MHGVPGIYRKFYVTLFLRNPVPLDLLNQTIPATEKKKKKLKIFVNTNA